MGMSNSAVLEKPKKRIETHAPQRRGNAQTPIERVKVSMRLRRDVYANLTRVAAMERQSAHLATNGLASASPMYVQDIVDAALEAWLKGKKKWQQAS